MNGRASAVAIALGLFSPPTACTAPDAVQSPPDPVAPATGSTSGDSSLESSGSTPPAGSTGTEDTSTGSTSEGTGSDASSGSSTGEPDVGWMIEIVDQDSTVAGTTSIDLDADGGVHIAYLDVNGGEDRLRYAHLLDGAWTFATIDEGRTGWHCSLRLDPSGRPHVSHYAFSDGELRYSSLVDGTWSTEVVDDDGLVGRKSSLRFDADGNPRISYHDTMRDDLKFAAYDGGSWATEVVDAADSVGDHTAMALDADGQPHIAYYLIVSADGTTGGDLRFASRDADGWQIETVDAEGVVGSFTSLALAANGTPHVSYRDDSQGRLKYASGGAAWQVEVIDDDGNLGDFNTALALDARGRPHVTYYNIDGGELRLASRDAAGWTHEIIDDELFSGHYSSLVIDPATGSFKISYSFRHDDDPNPVGPIGLKYAQGHPSTR